jgi:hypothetical protein
VRHFECLTRDRTDDVISEFASASYVVISDFMPAGDDSKCLTLQKYEALNSNFQVFERVVRQDTR